MSNNYKVERFAPTIETSVVSKLEKYVEDFYRASDTPPPSDSTDPYLEYFTVDASVKIALNEANGAEQLTTMRQGMWAKVKQRKHQVLEVAQLSVTEFLWTGTVKYKLVNDKELVTEWAALARFSDESLTKMHFYQVYLDSSQAKAALTE